MNLSVVIIVSKHDAAGTERTIQSVTSLDADILLYDITRTAFAEAVAARYSTRFLKAAWEGYEQVRYHAARMAKFDWILMLHTGEVVDKKLHGSLRQFDYQSRGQAYRIRFLNRFEEKSQRYGYWIRDYRIRFANRTCVKVDNQRVNETIFSNQGVVVKRMKGAVLHSSVKNKKALQIKIIRDAMLAALKYHRLGRKPGIMRQFFSPPAAFIQQYFFKLGFLDGRAGFVFASKTALYSRLKYARLKELQAAVRKQP